jgi:ATP-dependent RNA helicase RhlE
MNQNNLESGFAGLGLDPELLSALGGHGYQKPTPIQAEAIPHAVAGKDIVGIAQTGTGKTLAFLAPILNGLGRGSVRRALILAPTRELALQIEEVCEKIARPFGYRSAVLIGGASMGRQIAQLRSRPEIIVATPGRLQDHIDSKRLTLRDVSVVVLDEADRMLDMGFLPAVERLMEHLPSKRQTMLFSATMPTEIASLASRFMSGPVTIEIERPGTAATNVRQELFVIPRDDKNAVLDQILVDYDGTILVFARTRHGARKLAKVVRSMGHSAAEIHSDRTMAQRREALDGFKDGRFRVLVATDIASRGIDVRNIGVVVNYDLPENPDDYVHRIGRTGRAGENGVAITLATPDQSKEIRLIERAIRSQIPRNGHSAELERPDPGTKVSAHVHRHSRAKRPFGRSPRNGTASALRK